MKIFYENLNDELENVVKSNAMYQKVLVLYDDSVSNLDLMKIKETIKGFCVYNQMSISNLDISELYNGYKLLIYKCGANELLKCNFDRDEFINIYMPTDDVILPCFLSNNNLKTDQGYLFLSNSKIDIVALISVYFNQFFYYTNNIFTGGIKNCNFDFKEITQYNLINSINHIKAETSFVDIEIVKKYNLKYSDLVLVDLVIIDAFLTMISSLKNDSYMIVDVYKASKDDDSCIDKLYRLYNNDSLKHSLILNYNFLLNQCLETKKKLIELMRLISVDINVIENVINAVKQYCKNDNGLMAYLYLYNIFNV